MASINNNNKIYLILKFLYRKINLQIKTLLLMILNYKTIPEFNINKITSTATQDLFLLP